MSETENPEDIQEDIDEIDEDDFPAECPQCNKKAKDSRFCPFCGHDKTIEETFSDQQIELLEEQKRTKLKEERMGRIFFIFAIIHLFHFGKLYLPPFGEFLYFLFLGYMGVLLCFSEAEFRYHLIKKPKKKFRIGFLIGGIFGLLQGLFMKFFSLGLTSKALWPFIYWIGTGGVIFPIFFFGVFQPTLEKLTQSRNQSLWLTALAYSSCALTYNYSWQLLPIYFSIGLYLGWLKRKADSLHPLFYTMLSAGVLLAIIPFI